MVRWRRRLGAALFAAAGIAVACVGEDPGTTPSSVLDGGGDPAEDAGGTAACLAPKATCGADCADLQSDPAHCGDCTTACPSTTCFEGVCSGDKIKQVSTGNTSTCALRVSGAVYCWGRGDVATHGQRFESGGVPCDGVAACQPVPLKVPNLEPVESMSVAHQAACVVTKKQEVYCWGRNHVGELGVPLAQSQTCDNDACVDKPTKVAGLPAGVTQVSLGFSSACARTTAGEVWCWGANSVGQLGRGDLTPSEVPVKVNLSGPASQITVSTEPFAHACAVVGNRVWCWGANGAESLGHDSTGDQFCTDGAQKCNPTPTKITAVSDSLNVGSVIAGAAHTCALTHQGDVYCWGYGGYNAGPIGTSSAVGRKIPSTTPVKALAGRRGTACILRSDGSVGCWGMSNDARLGYIEANGGTPCVAGALWSCNNGNPSPIATAQITHLDMFENGFALREDGRLFAWGPGHAVNLARSPAASPTSCPKLNGEAGSTPCADVPVEIVLPTH